MSAACRSALLVLALAAASAPWSPAQDRPSTAPATRPSAVPGGIHHQPIAEQLPSSRWLSKNALVKWARDTASSLQPNDGGAIWIGIVVMLLVAGRFAPFHLRWNLELLMLLAVAVLFADLVPRQHRLDRPWEREVFTLAFTLIYAMTAWWVVRGFVGSRTERRSRFNPALPTAALAAGAIVLVLLNGLIAAVRQPDDCGLYSNLGTQRMLETGTLPYGDPALRSGAAATYGPVLYLAHAPLQMLAGTHRRNPPDMQPIPQAGYREPPVWVTKTVAFAFQALGLVALFLVGRRLMGAHVGWALVCLYAGSPYVLGVGGGETRIGGMGYVSHIVPGALTIAAFLAWRAPVVCGALLALAAGTVYYPAFMFPAWFAFHRSRNQAARFTIGFGAMALVLAGIVVAFTRTAPGENAVKLFFESTLEHQEAAGQYGSSPFSFFGVHPGVRETWAAPIRALGDSSLLKPTFLFVAAYSLLGFLLGRGRTLPQLAMLLASIAAAVQLWKTHATGSYVEWYYPFLLIGLLCQERAAGTPPAPATQPGAPASQPG